MVTINNDNDIWARGYFVIKIDAPIAGIRMSNALRATPRAIIEALIAGGRLWIDLRYRYRVVETSTGNVLDARTSLRAQGIRAGAVLTADCPVTSRPF